MSFISSSALTRRRSQFFRLTWAEMNVGQKILAVVIISIISLAVATGIIAILGVGHLVGGFILVWLVGLATAGAVQLTLLQGFAISVLFSILVASLQAISRAARGR